MLKSKVCRLCAASFVPIGNEHYCKECFKMQAMRKLAEIDEAELIMPDKIRIIVKHGNN
jgi:hypothetical protein